MDPEVRQNTPGACPKCGMALEAETVDLQEEENPEMIMMKRRFWVSLILTLPIFLLAMVEMVLNVHLEEASGFNLF
jgi:P-type Cu+ transporter